MKLTKHHGLGNDFLIALVDDVPADAADLARRLCHRRTGLGADGLVFGQRDGDEIRFVLHNADGGRAEVSGNGLRCLGQALALDSTQGGAETTWTVQTDAGPRHMVVRPSEDPAVAMVEVEMGAAAEGPSLGGRDPLEHVDGVRASSVDIGNPHIVIEVADPTRVDMAVVGPAIESAFLPTGTNVHVVAPTATDTLTMSIWERGVGITWACGSGACAAAVAGRQWGLVGDRVTVEMPGGSAVVEVGDPIKLIGPATFVGSIEVDHG